MKKNDKKQLTRADNILFTVKFEDGKTVQLTAPQIGELKDKRRYEVLDRRGEVILRKTFRGV